MHAVELLPHPEIEQVLAQDPRRNVFALHVCRERPLAASPAFAVDGEIRGALVRGSEHGIGPVQSAWLWAEDADGAEALLACARQTDRLEGLQLPLAYAPLVPELCPDFRVSEDVYLTRPPGPAPVVDGPGELVPIEPAALVGLTVPDDLRRSFGPLTDLPPGRFWGLAVDGGLVALADGIVHYGDVVTIQQVYCLPSARRRGHTTRLLALALAQPTVAGRTATWLASAQNTASIALARAVGFGATEKLGVVERAVS
jgi:ribosomal protein S18 acetylase RimI-like enzyme